MRAGGREGSREHSQPAMNYSQHCIQGEQQHQY